MHVRKHGGKIIQAAFILAMAMMAVPFSSVAATTSYEKTVTNSIELGAVDISLSEYETDEDGKEVPYRNIQSVLPGQNVENIVRITNKANAAWVRVRIGCESEFGVEDFLDGMIAPDEDTWIKRGNYWYCLTPLDTAESVDFIHSIHIPEMWDTSYAGENFDVTIRADAVQTKNFTPDFDAEDPWFGTVIEAFTKIWYPGKATKTNSFSIVFEGGADGLVKIGDDFFSNWETLMPGDVVSDKVLIRNDYANPTKIYFRTANVANDDLLKKLKIKITNENDVILDGALSDTVNDEVLIAELKKGEEKELSYTVTVPAELRNAYAMTDTKTQWIFRAEIEKQGSGSGGSFGSSGSKKNYAINGGTGGPGAEQETGAIETTETEKTNAENSEDKGHKDSDNSGKNPITDLMDRTKDVINKHIPKMGDDNVGTVAFCFMSASAFLLLIIFVGDKKNKKKKGDKNGES